MPGTLFVYSFEWGENLVIQRGDSREHVYAILVKKFGEHYLRWYEKRDPWALYKADITDIVNGGSINWLNFAYFMQPYSRFVQ